MSVSDTTYTHVLDGYHRQKNDIDKIRAENADLKARLKAARMTYFGTKGERIDAGADFDEDNGEDFDTALERVTNLKRKNWRKARGEGR